MQAYIVDCDTTLCEQCGAELIAEHGPQLATDLESPLESEDLNHAGETDCPTNCTECGRYLEAPLTPAGVQYVIEKITEELHDLKTDPDILFKPIPADDRLSYYRGSRRCDIVRDWAQDIDNYGGLSLAEKWLIDHYLEVTAPGYQSPLESAARALLAKVDAMTSLEFSQGAERAEREALRALLG